MKTKETKKADVLVSAQPSKQTKAASGLMPEKQMESLRGLLQGISFTIDLRGGDSLPCGTTLERFELWKKDDDAIWIRWSVGFGGFWNNPGAGGEDLVPSIFFIQHDLEAFAAYLCDEYKDMVSHDYILNNREIRDLFDYCTEEMANKVEDK